MCQLILLHGPNHQYTTGHRCLAPGAGQAKLRPRAHRHLPGLSVWAAACPCVFGLHTTPPLTYPRTHHLHTSTQAQATDLRQGKQRLAALLKEARDEACALHRWNRQELRARREADREASQLRRQVARLMVRPRGRGTDPNASAPAVDTAADSASASEQKEDQEQEQEQLLEHEVDARGEQEIGQYVIIASLDARIADLEAQLERALAFNEETLDKAAARDKAYASRVQAEQEVEGAVRQAVAEKVAELEKLRGELRAHAARFAEVNVLVQELGEERAQVRALETRLAHYAGVVEAAEAKARASVDEIITLRIREDELLANAGEMEAAHGQCETLVAALREEVRVAGKAWTGFGWQWTCCGLCMYVWQFANPDPLSITLTTHTTHTARQLAAARRDGGGGVGGRRGNGRGRLRWRLCRRQRPAGFGRGGAGAGAGGQGRGGGGGN